MSHATDTTSRIFALTIVNLMNQHVKWNLATEYLWTKFHCNQVSAKDKLITLN